jgi:hypothetical protein
VQKQGDTNQVSYKPIYKKDVTDDRRRDKIEIIMAK